MIELPFLIIMGAFWFVVFLIVIMLGVMAGMLAAMIAGAVLKVVGIVRKALVVL